MTAVCELCPHRCRLTEGALGLCRGRINRGGVVTCLNYGRITSAALDPIEKKPLYHFHPGSFILSVGSFGCNLRCPFCQNSDISMADASFPTQEITPAGLVATAADLARKQPGNLGVAFTYNEPLIGYEFVRDTAELLRQTGLKAVLVTNGTIEEEPLRALLPFIDAWNIDLKGFSEEFYRYVGGDLATVKRTITLAAATAHVEVTTLIVPGLNDEESMLVKEVEWLKGISPEIPLHISRFFPRYKETSRPPTPVDTVYKFAALAGKYLRHVHTGNC